MQQGLSWEEQKRAYELRESHYWKDMHVGQEFEPFVFKITEELVEDIMETTGDRNPICLDDAAAKRTLFPDRVVPQAAAVIFGRLAYLGDIYRPAPGGMALEISFSFAGPIFLGDEITSKSRIVAKEERKGKKFFTMRAESFNQHGDLVSIMEQSGILPV